MLLKLRYINSPLTLQTGRDIDSDIAQFIRATARHRSTSTAAAHTQTGLTIIADAEVL